MIKVFNKACQILAALCGLATLVFFFFDFAKFTTGSNGIMNASGLQISFGTTVGEVNLFQSEHILLCLILTILAFAIAVFSFLSKSQGLKYFGTGFSAAAGIYLLVVALSNPWHFVDTRPISTTYGVTDVQYGKMVLIAAITMLVMTLFFAAHVLLSDKIAVIESKGAKKTLIKRITQFFKDYKSECKKIVWPGLKDVVKNTSIVFAMFILIGVIIWLVDLGLGSLITKVLSGL